jgi:hypothetical protein
MGLKSQVLSDLATFYQNLLRPYYTSILHITIYVGLIQYGSDSVAKYL